MPHPPERRVPTADHLVSQILQLVDVGCDGVFLLSECDRHTGEGCHTTGFATVVDGRSFETPLFFGGAAKADRESTRARDVVEQVSHRKEEHA